MIDATLSRFPGRVYRFAAEVKDWDDDRALWLRNTPKRRSYRRKVAGAMVRSEGWFPLASHLRLTPGDLTGSRSAYEDFFKILKSADADLPILIDANREYERRCYGGIFWHPLACIRAKHDHSGRRTLGTDQRRFNEDNGLHPSGVPIAMIH
jgi:hypothetical protein